MSQSIPTSQRYGADFASQEKSYSSHDETPMDDHSDKSLSASPEKRWHMEHEVIQMKKDSEAAGYPAKRLGVTWNGLTVKGKANAAVLHDTVLSLFDIPGKIKAGRRPAPDKVILEDSFGCVRPGQVLLVLARPGGGATTLLNVLSNNRAGYTEVEGDVLFGTLDHEQAKKYRGEIVMNSEEEIFYPSMTVGHTIEVAAGLKTPAHVMKDPKARAAHREKAMDFFLRSMAIPHTKDTKVGNEYIRGVSGGERKRLSIIEAMATGAAVICWDNSTRGLDASTALNWAQAVRTITDVLGISSIMTLYQAGNGIYELVDDVLVLDHGITMFYGPRPDARPFFESLGFRYTEGANVADMLTGVTVPTERKIAPGFEGKFPRTARDIREAYKQTKTYQDMLQLQDYPESKAAEENTAGFMAAVAQGKSSSLPKDSPLTVSALTQVRVLAKRQFRQVWGDKLTLGLRQFNTVVQALIMGSLFWDVPSNSTGLLLRGGVMFFSVVYHALLALQEVEASFKGRAVLAKQKGFALFHPVAFVFAQILSDLPIVFVQVTLFSLILYFMSGLLVQAGSFFTYFAILYSTTMCVTAFFRMIGTSFSTFNDASKVGGLAILVLFTYSGYIVQRPYMKPWFEWIVYIDPLAYTVEALLSTELHNRDFPCEDYNIVPFGPEYAGLPSSCSGIPAASGTFVRGDDYLSFLSYSHGNVWRNFGILWAWWLLFVAITCLIMTYGLAEVTGGARLEFARNNATLTAAANMKTGVEDEEKQGHAIADVGHSAREGASEPEKADLIRNTSVFTWKNLTYTVKVPGGERVLLDKVSGFIKPGSLGALMGSSGAGKTTLMDVLAQRKTEGEISGTIHVDGRQLPLAFQRSAGYCEQLDVHEPLASVREALIFSAMLRQSRDVPEKEKVAYVETIIDLLEMRDIEHALVGTTGNGLSVEQRKRLTIGVELVAKPSILLFLDEPTSGLDSQSAFSIVKFLRKLADVGQAVLVTIHQPSASLFYEFDTLLLLAAGGKTVYNGPIGDHASTVKNYFATAGAPCPPNGNPAEHMISVVSGELSSKEDWHEIWLRSEESHQIMDELERIEADALSKPVAYNDMEGEFAASLWQQCLLVNKRNSISLFRDTEYVTNKAALHIFAALFNGFTFWMIGESASDLQLKVFSVFSFVFVASGVIAQVQPLFIARRDIFEKREKLGRLYSWKAFTFGLIVSEFPYLLLCAILYFFCWYYTCGFPAEPSRAGAAFLEVLLYEFIYTGVGQFIAAYAPTASIASLFTPLLLGTLLSFCGVFVPYSEMPVYWKYWLYYLDVFTYIVGSLLWFVTWDKPVVCTVNELTNFDPPIGQTCGQYLETFLTKYNPGANLLNPQATEGCQVCPYRTGNDYLNTIELGGSEDGWRNVGITAIFVISSYGMVFLMMKLRTKASKRAD